MRSSNRDHPTILWLRQDLRLADQPALVAAVARGGPVIAIYILDEERPGRWRPGGASHWWLHHSLGRLGDRLAAHRIPLVLRKGPPASILPALVRETGAGAVYWCRCYEPYARGRDEALKASLRETGLDARSFNGSLLFEPWTIAKPDGGGYRVFGAFWRACLAAPAPPAPAPAPPRPPEGDRPEGHALDALGLLPQAPDWAGGLRARWIPGEAGARDGLARLLDERLGRYGEARDQPGRAATSELSAALHFGEISPRTIFHAVRMRAAEEPALAASAAKFLSELGWREFAHHLLFHNPDMPDMPLDPTYRNFPWAEDDGGFRAWTKGLTGYPIVDAGMRELWQTGFMHNRVRMIAASFLVKDLLIPWQQGEAWFWDTLVDADLANNAMNWQWVAGSGADAAPFFRILNPVLQGERFDAAGGYVRRFLPEIAKLPDRFLHKPWTAPTQCLAEAGITLGKTYPYPIIDHVVARRRALGAFASRAATT